MMVRDPVVAGRFYPIEREACLREIASMKPASEPPDFPSRPVGGIVPHAGWVFSGATALAVLKAIASHRKPKTFVLFGATHRGVPGGSVFASGGWQTPLGVAEVDGRLAGEILGRAPDLLADDPEAHEGEHSIEVQVPLIQCLLPEAKIVPILVPPDRQAAALGAAVGQTILSLEADAVCIGSSDLTHYGPMYGFTPAGTGAAAIRWVRDDNDRRMLDLIVRMDAQAVVPESQARLNACGGGAIAATIAAARELGAARGHILHYTTSFDVMRETMGQTDYEAAVGYVGAAF